MINAITIPQSNKLDEHTQLISINQPQEINFIDREGYHIIKKNISSLTINNLKKFLTVSPNQNNNYVDNTIVHKLYTDSNDILTIPRFVGFKNFGMLTYKNQPLKTNIVFNGTLRDYQIDIANTCKTKIVDNNMMGGIITIPCGFGKTVIAIYLACLLGIKTLIVVHKTFLLLQWIERVQQFTNARIGIIRQDTIDVIDKDIIIGMIQSISKKNYDPSIFSDIGLVIFDECHHTPSKVFSKCLQKTSFMYTIGLSATPNRSDGLTKIMHWYLGNPLYILQKPKDNNVYVKTFLYTSSDPLFIEKKRWFKKKLSPAIPEMITNISSIHGRNILIKNIICSIITSPNRKILVLSERLEHLEELKNLVDADLAKLIENNKLIPGEITTTKYIGGMKDQQQKLAALGDIIFASSSLAEEGLDIDGLNTLILATPKTKIEQSIGRIMRKPIKDGDVFPLVIDIVDMISNFKTWGITKRYSFYYKNGYKINKYWAHDDSCITPHDYCISNGWGTKESLADVEELKYTYIKNIDSEYEYAILFQENKLDEYWESINYQADFNKIFEIKYEWEIKNLRQPIEDDNYNEDDSILFNSSSRKNMLQDNFDSSSQDLDKVPATEENIVLKKDVSNNNPFTIKNKAINKKKVSDNDSTTIKNKAIKKKKVSDNDSTIIKNKKESDNDSTNIKNKVMKKKESDNDSTIIKNKKESDNDSTIIKNKKESDNDSTIIKNKKESDNDSTNIKNKVMKEKESDNDSTNIKNKVTKKKVSDNDPTNIKNKVVKKKVSADDPNNIKNKVMKEKVSDNDSTNIKNKAINKKKESDNDSTNIKNKVMKKKVSADDPNNIKNKVMKKKVSADDSTNIKNKAINKKKESDNDSTNIKNKVMKKKVSADDPNNIKNKVMKKKVSADDPNNIKNIKKKKESDNDFINIKNKVVKRKESEKDSTIKDKVSKIVSKKKSKMILHE